MAAQASNPERRFLRVVFGEQIAEPCLDAFFARRSKARLEELRGLIHAALATLSFRERSVLEMRFGFGDGYPYTLAQTGYVFRLTRERVRQIQAKAMRKVRQRGVGLQEFVERMSRRRA